MTYTEDLLIEQPAINLFGEMGWETAICWDESFGVDGTFGRDNRSDVILYQPLKDAIRKLNPGIDPVILQNAVDEMARDRSAMSAIAANEEIHQLLKQGYKFVDSTDEGDDVVVRFIDWNTPENNHFLLCSQMFISGEIETRRPDLIGFVNGLPLVFIELKASHKQLINAYKDNLKDYRNTIPQLFHYNQLIILSNGIQSRVGTVSSQWEHFAEWKKIASEDEERKVSLEVAIRGTCDKSRLLDLVENFTLFVKTRHTIKVLAKYHQYLGVNESLAGLENIKQRNGQLGVFWHTQGSGKSFSMVFFTQKAFRKYPGNWTFVVVTDRADLDEQIYKTFNTTGMLNELCLAESGAELKQLLSEDHRFVFTLIQKFKGDNYPVLSERDDIVVITDEAHRSQYASLAMNMRKSMPNAGFMAFTGTPLLADKTDEGKTREVFGDYVSIYNFADAVDDGATLPLYYENRVPEVSLNREDLGKDLLEILDNADLTEEQQSKLETEFGRAYHIITRDDRLDTIAKDLVSYHINREPFSGGLWGKAMVVSIDKATAIKMYDKVQHHWKLTLESLKTRIRFASGSSQQKLHDQIAYMESTDMAVVVSSSQNDHERLAKKGLDFRPHRERMIKEDLDDKFKDPEDPLRIVFVCAMWLTGFDAQSVSTLYLDKPLKNHTLMQTIARANRVFPGKPCGQIVDYINIFGALQTALGRYGGGVAEDGQIYDVPEDVDSPANSKLELLNALTQAIVELKLFLTEQEIDLLGIIATPPTDFRKLQLLDEASDKLLEPANKDTFTSFVRQINRIFKAILPDSSADSYVQKRIAINVIYKQMREKSGLSVDDEDVLDVVRHQVNELLDESIETIKIDSNLPDPVNIAGIDFDALAEMVSNVTKPRVSDAEKLKNLIARKLAPMVARNKSRQDLQQKFKELVDEYNLGAYTAEEFFRKLQSFIQTLSDEESRTVREGLSEEEMAIFDLLSKGVQLSEKDRNEVKKVAKDLTDRMKGVLVLDWRKKQRTKARVRNFIEEMLDQLPEVYDDNLWPRACDDVFLHIYDKYPGQGVSLYH
ncbi:type I restriction endonuclease subunit R [Endozoicomonas sp. YOMI1]|uniref:type I restriction endonuclease subunit R n=1 Tax=Endozoicomonas sp. YOMI1 TaxID=2828739 RepID=UPI0021485A0B|nr:type I restriction endonuclease subunit R [Endozoicomonas sp. YOMI1]